ncbi:MAG: tail fiber domain-containing protein, partial [Chthonomonadaceae bacterium]|nr:tail fiber domain-containing protein [Chthonomonadaceae bacterium]
QTVVGSETYTSGNVIGGFWLNGVRAGVTAATIAGGGVRFNATDLPNRVFDIGGTVGGGVDNRAGSDDADLINGELATVGGGQGNNASGSRATVAGGGFNTASELDATVGGGQGNNASGPRATVAGGSGNTASGYAATVGGGGSNTASGYEATVGGGGSNTASGPYATVAGGGSNTASGYAATIPGGSQNRASGTYSFAAGYYANAQHTGAFVWGDNSTSSYITSTANNQFSARAAGGVRFFSNAAMSTGVTLAPGSGTWASLSDRRLKENFQPVDLDALLHRILQVPVMTWNYRSQPASVRHIGPMAQDFHAAFGVGEDPTRICSVDADGVALAGIQALYRQMERDRARLKQLEAENAELRTQMQALLERVERLEQERR